MIAPFREHERLSARKLNAKRGVFAAAQRVRGDGLITVNYSGGRFVIGLDIDALVRRVGPQ